MLIFWVGIIIVSILIEFVTTSALVSIWFAIGALVALLLAFLQANVVVQVVSFFVVSMGCMLMVRPMASRYLRGNVVATNADRVIHEIGVVTKTISESEWGEVIVSHTIWSAVEKDGKRIEEGCKVKVLAIEGAKLIVQKY